MKEVFDLTLEETAALLGTTVGWPAGLTSRELKADDSLEALKKVDDPVVVGRQARENASSVQPDTCATTRPRMAVLGPDIEVEEDDTAPP